MRTLVFLLTIHIVLVALVPIADAASESADAHKVGPNQGLTLHDIGRGLKSAGKNIEHEIPKIGTAMGETFKEITDSKKEKDQPRELRQTSTKSKK